MTEHYTHVVGNDLREWTDRLGETYKFTVEG